MKTLKTIGLLLLMATGVLAQPNPNNMFITGYVTDANGGAVANQEVCVYYYSNNPSLPSDSVCTSTNANGWYYFDIANGSVTGPNVVFEVYTNDPCSFLPLSQSISNNQGTTNTATADFVLCSNSSGCQASFTVDSSITPNGVTYTFTGAGTGTPPFTYSWWLNGQSLVGQTVSYTTALGNVIGVCLTISDGNGCTSDVCDTIGYYGGNGCSVEISSVLSNNSPFVYTTTAVASGVAPFTYVWDNNSTSHSTTYAFNQEGIYGACVTVTDATGCVVTDCDTLVVDTTSNGNCSADFNYWSNSNPNGGVVAGQPANFYFTGSLATFNYYFWSVQGMGISLTSYQQNPVFTFPAAGWYNVCVEVYDSLINCSDTQCMTIVVGNGNSGGCQAFFGWATDSLLGGPLPAIDFTDLSQGGASWFWDFGDNNFSTEQNPIHAYTGNGLYLVCLTITSADQSCTDTYCDSVWVGTNSGGCNASFSYNGPTPVGYVFEANTLSALYNYQWTIDGSIVGNGSTLNANTLSNGPHNVCLTVIDSTNWCYDSQCITITVGTNTCYGYISGQVNAGTPNQPLDEGVVYLITFDANTNQLSAVDSFVVDSSNYYWFGPLACGDYLIKAAATAGSQYYSNYIPTYYGNSPFWGLATEVTLDQVNTQVTSDINLIAAVNPGGPGFIGGDVTEGANKTEGDPLAGMQVVLFDMSGNAIQYAYTDANGQFGFDGLAYGTYQVYVEVLGVQTIPAIVTISSENPSVDDLHILASETLISTGIEEFDFDGAISEVFPNPTSTELSVKFELPTATDIRISVLDLTGRVLFTRSNTVEASQVRFDVSSLTEGYYLLSIEGEDGSFSVTRNFMRID